METKEVFYSLSPFDAGPSEGSLAAADAASLAVAQSTRVIAITVLVVFGAIFLAGFIGHLLVLCFASRRQSHRNAPLSSAYVILANCSAAQLAYVCTCLPAIAYRSVMALVTREWIFGDVTCRMTSYIEALLLAATVFSYCALAIDRLRCAGHVGRDRGDVTRDSRVRGACKLLVLWLGCMLLAAPEMLMRETRTAQALVRDPPVVFEESRWRNNGGRGVVFQREEYIEMLRRSAEANARLIKAMSTYEDASKGDIRNVVERLPIKPDNSTSPRVSVEYRVCVEGGPGSWKNLPSLLAKFMAFYAAFRHWWLFALYFFVPVATCAGLCIAIARRLARALRELERYAGKGSPQPGSEAGGTLNARAQDLDLAPIVEHTHNYPTDSLPSNRTYTSDSLYQHRLAMDRQFSQSSYMQYHARLSPLLSSEDLTENETSPVLKIAANNGSIRTIASSHRHLMSSESAPLSPVAPSVACMSGISVLSLAYSNNPGTLGNNSSLPPHGRGKSVRRRSSRIHRQTIHQVARERSINFLLAMLVVSFVLTQLPLRVCDILRRETNWFEQIDARYAALLRELSLNFSVLTFAISPIVMFLCYQAYRRYLLNVRCPPCCSCL